MHVLYTFDMEKVSGSSDPVRFSAGFSFRYGPLPGQVPNQRSERATRPWLTDQT